MRRFIAASAALLLLFLISQAVLAQYEPSGSLVLSPTTVTAGGQVNVSGTGFAADSQVQVTTQPDPELLATGTTDSTGAFSVDVTIPASFSGEYSIVATGVDPNGSVLVLTATLTVTASEVPPTSQAPGSPIRGSDPIVLAIAGIGIVGMTGLVLLFASRRRRSLG
jgi:hypothetical protein